jgi:hypothetical protein
MVTPEHRLCALRPGTPAVPPTAPDVAAPKPGKPGLGPLNPGYKLLFVLAAGANALVGRPASVR